MRGAQQYVSVYQGARRRRKLASLVHGERSLNYLGESLREALAEGLCEEACLRSKDIYINFELELKGSQWASRTLAKGAAGTSSVGFVLPYMVPALLLIPLELSTEAPSGYGYGKLGEDTLSRITISSLG
ncbi:hypothetical protein MUK42_32699 [Musa troglodytarum]|uniref:Uncharacterized protein n=1 Tax=Musa troglodytarum TaxID=320322 RepID=A0A9E7L6Q7_9LILI|nr:hypothetical protein MUK42_32699 [Musa troglodytarum]